MDSQQESHLAGGDGSNRGKKEWAMWKGSTSKNVHWFSYQNTDSTLHVDIKIAK